MIPLRNHPAFYLKKHPSETLKFAQKLMWALTSAFFGKCYPLFGQMDFMIMAQNIYLIFFNGS